MKIRAIEQARVFRSLIELNGWSARRLARELGYSQPSVVRTLALLNLPASVQAEVEKGIIASTTAYELSKLKDPVEQHEIAAMVVQHGLSRAAARKLVRRFVPTPQKGRGRPRLPRRGLARSSWPAARS